MTYSVTTSPNDLNVYIDTYDVLRWDRSYLTSTDSSSLIYLTVTDSLGAKLTLDPFRFEPNFIPLISDLTSPVEIKDDAIYVAYTNSFWQRSFTITDGLGTSTTVSSNDLNAQNTEVTLNPTSSTFTFSNGMILWTPDEIMTHTLTVKYSDMAQPAYNVTRQFIIEVEDNNQPIFITISESKRIAIIGQIYTIEFSDH